MRALAVVVALHGAAHFVGTSESFTRAADGESVVYVTGAWTISDPSLLRGVGVLWALLGIGFLLAGVAIWTGALRRRVARR
jgi:hypothetical protein